MTTKNRAAVIRKIERRVRAKYVRRCWLCFIFALLIGLAAGIYLCTWGPLKNFSDSVRSNHGDVVTAEATVEPDDVFLTDTPAPEATEEAPVVTATPAPVVTEAPTVPPTKEPTKAPTEAPTPVAAPEVTQAAEAEDTDETQVASADTAETTAPVEDEGTALAETDATEAADASDAVEVAVSKAAEVADAATDEGEAPVEATDAAPAEDETAPAEPAGTVMVDADGNVMGTMENPIPMGTEYTFDTEIVQGGTPRYAVSMAEYDTVNVTAAVKDYLTPDYFAEKYSSKYKLQGNEAGAALGLTLNDSTGTQFINPQDALLVCFESEDGTIAQGYQLMNAEIAGDYGVPLEREGEQVYYKRFAYTTDPEMKYLTLTYYVDGQAVKVYFSLEPNEEAPADEGAATEEAPATEDETPAVSYNTLEVGSRGDDVQKLQERLIQLGYLDGAADGIFGNMTKEAISAAQEKGNMEATGIADADFQTYIFSDGAVAK